MNTGQHVSILEPTSVFNRYETAEIMNIDKSYPHGALAFVRCSVTEREGYILVKHLKPIAKSSAKEFTRKRPVKKCPTCHQILQEVK